MDNTDELTPSPLPSLQNRFILTQVDRHYLVFPSSYAAEILLVERSQILVLPFYDRTLLGVVHYHGRIVPLAAIQYIFDQTTNLTRETISVVQLSQDAGHVAGMGIVVDRVLESRSREQLPDEIFTESLPPSPPLPESIHLFRPELLGDRLWLPQRRRSRPISL
ncbi:MAG: chemotaxis protein CheW [Elainellaceae cyanobacterium]